VLPGFDQQHRRQEFAARHKAATASKLPYHIMKIVSLNVGLPRLVEANGEPVNTGIFKEPVESPVLLRTLNLDGDRQADLRVHGGISKAVYAYPVEHYAFWKKEFPEMDLPYGMFGENLTTEGMLEENLNIGDRFRVGEAELMVTEPRMPCYKLGIKFGRSDIIRKFLQSRRSGFYFAVRREGNVEAGNSIELLARDPNNVTISDITRLYAFEKDDWNTMRRAMKVEALPESWRGYFQQQIEKVQAETA
jgi:MOSC domain-containing protein YiiM